MQLSTVKEDALLALEELEKHLAIPWKEGRKEATTVAAPKPFQRHCRWKSHISKFSGEVVKRLLQQAHGAVVVSYLVQS